MNIVAIGDVHGCITKLQQAIQPLIGSQSEVVFLGDLIDRAPEENGDLRVLQLVHFMEQNPEAFGLSKVTVLTGNHEQMFLEAYETGDDELWEYNGGNPDLFEQAAPFIQWLRDRPPYYVVSDLLFVHAGVRPAVPLEEQTLTDLTWIRDPFLDSPSHGLPYTVIHGHTYVPEPEFHSDRIAIDTGACFGGPLTALNISY
jgi:serine/threonine protein phosphatase 1